MHRLFSKIPPIYLVVEIAYESLELDVDINLNEWNKNLIINLYDFYSTNYSRQQTTPNLLSPSIKLVRVVELIREKFIIIIKTKEIDGSSNSKLKF